MYYNFTKATGGFVPFDVFMEMEYNVISEMLLIEKIASDKLAEEHKKKTK